MVTGKKKNSDERERQTGGAHPLGRGRAVNSQDKEREEETVGKRARGGEDRRRVGGGWEGNSG